MLPKGWEKQQQLWQVEPHSDIFNKSSINIAVNFV